QPGPHEGRGEPQPRLGASWCGPREAPRERGCPGGLHVGCREGEIHGRLPAQEARGGPAGRHQGASDFALMLPLAFRAYRPGPDTAFLFSAWIGSYRTSDRAGTIPDDIAYAIHKASIHRLLQRGMQVTMAVNPED